VAGLAAEARFELSSHTIVVPGKGLGMTKGKTKAGSDPGLFS
jgi:hypothetical protein